MKYVRSRAGSSVEFLVTAVVDQIHHDKGRRAKPRKGFYIIVCGRFEIKLL